MDSTTARAHHHAAGMVLDGELVKALEDACEQEKGLRQRGLPASLPVRFVESSGSTSGTVIVPPASSLTFDTGLTTQCLAGQITITHHRYQINAIGVTV